MSQAASGTVGFVSLGCAKNLIDSEVMLGRVASEGFALCADHRVADVVIVNTCGFLEASREESLATLREMAELKAEGAIKRLVVAGCMVGKYRDLLHDQIPQADALLSVNDREALTGILRELRGSGELSLIERIADPDRRGTVYDDRGRLRLTPRHYGYLRIAEGCDHTCSFCVIPDIRGRFRSKLPDQILAEARELVEDGARELIVIAQDTTAYGRDLGKEYTLAGLLRRVSREVEGLAWIRLMYAYPNQVTDELMETMAEEERILPYMDMPLQHINTRMLGRMRRGGSRAHVEGMITRLRARIPGFKLRSTFISGFPGESEAEHRELVDWVAQGWVDRLGCFPYSPEQKSHSFTLDGHLPESERLARHEEVMRQAQASLFAKNAAMVGSRITVMLDEPSGDTTRPWIARSVWDAPEVDCSVLCAVASAHKPGDMLEVRVTESTGFTLLADKA